MPRPAKPDRQRLASVVAWLGRIELVPLVLLLLVGAGLWAFVELADEVTEGDTAAWDRAILLSLRNPDDPSDPLGPRWLEELGRDVTALGGVGVLLFITVATAGFLALDEKRHAALFVLAAVLGGLLVSSVLKRSFERPRPDLVPHGSHVYTSSFPSGHSTMATATYLTLGALLARVSRRRVLKIYFLSLAIFLSLAVGISRVYLGVHWPSDVFAGWTLGASWALLCWTVALVLQRKGQVESEPPAERQRD
ncbi:MAG: phosphatase PAP2 family protein [Pirellulales bacterium]